MFPSVVLFTPTAFSLEPSKPDYDLDSEDEEWFVELKKKDHTFEDFTAIEVNTRFKCT